MFRNQVQNLLWPTFLVTSFFSIFTYILKRMFLMKDSRLCKGCFSFASCLCIHLLFTDRHLQIRGNLSYVSLFREKSMLEGKSPRTCRFVDSLFASRETTRMFVLLSTRSLWQFATRTPLGLSSLTLSLSLSLSHSLSRSRNFQYLWKINFFVVSKYPIYKDFMRFLDTEEYGRNREGATFKYIIS